MSVPLPVYLDNHATTRCDPAALEAMWPWFSEDYGNAASRSHALGLRARSATEAARASIASWLGASPKGVIFTSGATEANNLAILGLARAAAGRPRHVITVATEHKAVLEPVEALAREGVEVTVLPVAPDGRIEPGDVVAALRPHTLLVSIMRVNNEIGTIQPLAEVAEACRARGVRIHTDAAQSAYVPTELGALGVDLISVSSHKIYGPKGIGALVMARGRPRMQLEPLLHGGGHERGLRPGTLPVPLIVGFGVAARLLEQGLGTEPTRIAGLRDRLLEGLTTRLDGITIHGTQAARSPNNLNLSFEGVEAEALLMSLRADVALSTSSACSSESLQPSHVLRALYPDASQRAALSGSIRFGIGRFNTEAEIEHVIDAVSTRVTELRAMASLYEP